MKAFERKDASRSESLERKTTWGLDQGNKEQMITFTVIALIKPFSLLQE